MSLQYVSSVYNHREAVLRILSKYGARVSHRNKFLTFNEKVVTLLPDLEEVKGISIDDIVCINGSSLSPMVPSSYEHEEPWRDRAKFIGKVFRVVAFFEVSAYAGNTFARMTYCALSAIASDGLETMCHGQEVGRHDQQKLNLYWIGCLEKPSFINTNKVVVGYR